MTNCIEQTRVGCAVGGVYTALSIEGVLPVMHTGPGCFSTNEYIMSLTNGGQGSVIFRHGAIPCTNLTDADVVFGGMDKLEKEIEKTLEYYEAKLIIVISGCAAGLVGDDIEAVVKKFRDAKIPVIYADTPGFRGSNIFGHHEVLKSIINQYLGDKTPDVKRGLVNILGVVPGYDTYWGGMLDEINLLLTEIGLQPNILYGFNGGIDKVDKIPDAEFNLVFGPWVDVEIAQILEEKYKTPWLHIPSLPVGPTETTQFIRKLKKHANLDEEKTERIIQNGERYYYYYLERAMQWMYYGKNIPKKFYIIGGSIYTLALTKFLVNDAGFMPLGQFVVDNPPNEDETIDIFKKELSNLDSGITAEIVIEPDPVTAQERIRDIKSRELLGAGPSFLFGSAWDNNFAEEIESLLVQVGAPNTNVVFTKHFFGYHGGLNLLEFIFNAIPNVG